jgi:hypothetical protein
MCVCVCVCVCVISRAFLPSMLLSVSARVKKNWKKNTGQTHTVTTIHSHFESVLAIDACKCVCVRESLSFEELPSYFRLYVSFRESLSLPSLLVRACVHEKEKSKNIQYTHTHVQQCTRTNVQET